MKCQTLFSGKKKKTKQNKKPKKQQQKTKQKKKKKKKKININLSSGELAQNVIKVNKAYLSASFVLC